LRKAIVLLTTVAVALVLGSGVAMATITTTSNAQAIANAITRNTGWVTGASFVAVPPSGTPNAVSDTALTGFPTNGAKYGILTTGDAKLADDANNSGGSGFDNGGENVRGNTDYDVTILKTDLAVPSGVNCLAISFRFLSEEYPEWVGSEFNDAFIAELDNSTWSTSGSTINAPDNFAFGPSGEVISINGTGFTSVSSAAAAGTTYDSATTLLQAKTPITSGTHSLYLSIFDQGDKILDSAVFIDKLNLLSVASAQNCVEGADDITPPKVASVLPANKATGVKRNANLTATFSETMDKNTLTKSTFKLFKVNSDGTTTQITNVTVSSTSDGLKARLNPYGTSSTLLAKNTKYKAVVTTGAEDLAGNSLDQKPGVSGKQSMVWTFTTGSS
jgi:hypothetical protein